MPCVNVNQAPRRGGKKPRIFRIVRTERAGTRGIWGSTPCFQALLCSNRVVNSARKLTFRLASTYTLFYTLCKVTRGPEQEKLEKELDRVKQTPRLWRSCAPWHLLQCQSWGQRRNSLRKWLYYHGAWLNAAVVAGLASVWRNGYEGKSNPGPLISRWWRRNRIQEDSFPRFFFWRDLWLRPAPSPKSPAWLYPIV